MLTLNDGRSELWQWDTGRTLAVDADCSQVHFSNNVFGRSIDVDVADGAAIIPDILLQTDKDLNVWAFVGTAENGYTKISKTFKVNRRNKPAGYVFTPVEQTTIAEIAAIAQSVRDDADAGVFDGAQGPAGPQGKQGIPGPSGEPGAPGHTPEYGVDYGTPEQIADIANKAAGILQPDVNQLKNDLSDKLPKSPLVWEPWTAEEQAAARERMGIPGDYELIHDETMTEDITQYTIDNISLKKSIMLFYSVSYTSDNYLLVDYNLAGKGIERGSTIRAINKNGYVSKYYAYFDGGEFRNFSVGPARTNGGTTNGINTYSKLVFAERITSINLSAYAQYEIIPAGCRIKIYGVRA